MKNSIFKICFFVIISFAVFSQDIEFSDINAKGKFKMNGNTGTVGQVLTSSGTAAGPTWSNAATSNNTSGNIGYGVWGDCGTNGNISEYNPVTDATGAMNDSFGYSVAISGNFAIVGAYLDDVGPNSNQGSASIFQWNGTNWVLMQKITDATGSNNDNFGLSVSISGNYAIIGAPFDDNAANIDQGSASIYQWNGSAWVLMFKISDSTGTLGDIFGVSVSISANYAIVGAYSDDGTFGVNQGSASIYQWNGSSWVLMQKITDATGGANDLYGNSVSISGNYAIVGAPYDDGTFGIDQGSASIYQWNGTAWVLMQKITDYDASASDLFYFSVAISGNFVIIGAPNDDTPDYTNSGSTSTFQWNGTSWVLMEKNSYQNAFTSDRYGYSVAISNNYALIGAIGNSNRGYCVLYQNIGPIWKRLQVIFDPAGKNGESFGNSVALDGTTKRFEIGAPYTNLYGNVLFGKIN